MTEAIIRPRVQPEESPRQWRDVYKRQQLLLTLALFSTICCTGCGCSDTTTA